MTDHVETVIVGGGQAGLAVSYYLGRQGREHVVLEQSDHAASAWRDHRWDSFTLNTPNWQNHMPGAAYDGGDPDGFMSKQEVVAYLERYVERFGLPVRYGSRVAAVEACASGQSYLVTTTRGVSARARNVVVATGLYQRPRIPALGSELPADVRQVHSDAYRSPAELLPGAVLVVGSAQSGCQIAEELYRSGKKVYLAVGRSGRVPRRYRGKDTNWWSERLGFYDRTVDQLPTPRAKFFAKPHISGKDGGHSLNLHQFARDGVVLLGHLEGVDGDRIVLAPDLREHLAAADQFEAAFVKAIDEHIAQAELQAPPEKLPALRDGFAVEVLPSLNLRHAGISNVVWATSYGFDFSMVKLPVLDADGYPLQRRGVTSYPGLYFVGLPWLYNARSGLLCGADQDAAYVARAILADERCLIPADMDDVPARAWVSHDLCCS
jgi:putative flavoprotein involved in K+ transport